MHDQKDIFSWAPKLLCFPESGVPMRLTAPLTRPTPPTSSPPALPCIHGCRTGDRMARTPQKGGDRAWRWLDFNQSKPISVPEMCVSHWIPILHTYFRIWFNMKCEIFTLWHGVWSVRRFHSVIPLEGDGLRLELARSASLPGELPPISVKPTGVRWGTGKKAALFKQGP